MSIRGTKDTHPITLVLLQITHREIELFAGFTFFLSELNKAVKEKDWRCLDELIKKMNETAQAIVEVEKVREDTVTGLRSSLGVPWNEPFSEVLMHLNPEMRKEFAVAFKKLKMEVLKVKVAARGLTYYLASVSHLLRNVLEEIFPHTRGKIYANNGKDASRPGDAIMINREL